MTTSCGCDSRSPAVVIRMNSVSVRSAAMSHTPQYPIPLRTPPRVHDGGDLRDADTGHDTGRADRPGPHADLHGIDPALDERARARFGRDVAGDELRVGEGVTQTRHGVQHALAVAMRRVHDD